MKAVQLASFGDAKSALRYREDVATPSLNTATSDVLVQVEATSVNPIDLAIRKGKSSVSSNNRSTSH